MGSAERAQPTAEHAPPQNEQRYRHVHRQDENQWIQDKSAKPRATKRRLDVGQNVDDRQLAARIPAQPAKNERQRPDPDNCVGPGGPGQKVLEQENDGHEQQQETEDRDIDLFFAPSFHPHGHRRRRRQQHVAFRQLVGNRQFNGQRTTFGVGPGDHQNDVEGQERVQA